jgi:hypothetical protein
VWFKKSYRVSEGELAEYKALDKRMKAVDCLIDKLIAEAEEVCEQSENWWMRVRDKYGIKEETIRIDVGTGIITKVKKASGEPKNV